MTSLASLVAPARIGDVLVDAAGRSRNLTASPGSAVAVAERSKDRAEVDVPRKRHGGEYRRAKTDERRSRWRTGAVRIKGQRDTLLRDELPQDASGTSVPAPRRQAGGAVAPSGTEADAIRRSAGGGCRPTRRWTRRIPWSLLIGSAATIGGGTLFWRHPRASQVIAKAFGLEPPVRLSGRRPNQAHDAPRGHNRGAAAVHLQRY
jgi:hypothetical protein